MDKKKNVTAVLALFLLGACLEEDYSQSEQALTVPFGTAQLNKTWQLASHNTYEPAYTPSGYNIDWHLGNTTNTIEVDLRDTHYVYGQVPGNWIVAHNYTSPVTPHCGGGFTLSSCLYNIQQYHQSHPEHPLITVWLDKKEGWQSNTQSTSQRSPWRLDNLISTYFSDSELFLPINLRYWWNLSGPTVRDNALWYGWPAHSDLAGKVMFVMTSDVTCAGNDRQEQYVDNRGWNAKVFIAPAGNQLSYVTTQPQCFDAASTQWVAIYGFEWEDAVGNDGECDSNKCQSIPNAHDRNFLTRVYDIDDPAEYDKASRRPFGTGVYGHANFIAVYYPWQAGGYEGYGTYVDGIYPW